MMRLGFRPSLQSPFSTNYSSPICSSHSVSSKESCLDLARLSIISEESDTLFRAALRGNTFSSSLTQTSGNDFSNLKANNREIPQEGLHDRMSDVEGLKACSTSQFQLLMQNINVLEDTIADANVIKLEKEILEQLGRLGALELFHAYLSRMLTNPALSNISGTMNVPTEDYHLREAIDDASRIVVKSQKKEKRKMRRENSLTKIRLGPAESCFQTVAGPRSSSMRRSKRAKGIRGTISKNEAELAAGVKVVANLERIRTTLEEERNRAVSLSMWAEAAGIDEKVLRQRLHFGWYCRDELLKSTESLVVYISRNYRGLGLAGEDLLQAGYIGVLKGAERFDHLRGYKFSTYVQFWIRKTMSALVSQHARGVKVPLTLSSAINRIQKARKALQKSHGKYPDDIEIVKFTGLSLHKIQAASRCLRVVGSVNQKIADWSSVKFLECTPDATIEIPEKAIMKKNMRSEIIKLLNELNPKERQVLVLRYGIGGQPCRSLEEIGKKFHVSKEWIRKVEKKAMKKLRNEHNRNSLSHFLGL